MNTLKYKLQNASHSILQNMAAKGPLEWPPECTFFIYQPTRPQKLDNKQEQKKD